MTVTFYTHLLSSIYQTNQYHFETASTHYFEAWTHFYILKYPSTYNRGKICFDKSSSKSFPVLALETYKWCTQGDEFITRNTLMRGGCLLNTANELVTLLQEHNAHNQYVAFSKLIALFSIDALQKLFDLLYSDKYIPNTTRADAISTGCEKSSSISIVEMPLVKKKNNKRRSIFPKSFRLFKNKTKKWY